MKNYSILAIALTILHLNVYSQIVPSSCTANQSVVDSYYGDAQYMALQHTFNTLSPEVDSFQISTAFTNTFLDALIAVYNATSLPARDTVVEMIDIHHLANPTMNSFNVSADPNLDWMVNLSNDQFPTGNILLDAMMMSHGYEVTTYLEYNDQNFFHTAFFKSEMNHNLNPVVNALDADSGVYNAEQNWLGGDGNSLEGEITDTYIELIYTYAWGDCFSGCAYSRSWTFRVYDNCDVEYMGSEGDVTMGVGIQAFSESKVRLFPNPVQDLLQLEGISNQVNYQIFNINGQVVQTGSIGNSSISVTELPAGNYHLLLDENGETYRSTFVKY